MSATIKERIQNIWSFTKELLEEFSNDNCFRLSAALSYYTIFSLAPILIIVIFLVSYFFGAEAANGQIYSQIRELLGDEGAKSIQEMVKNAYLNESSTLMTIVAIGTLIFSTTVVFVTLQDSLNLIWKVKPKPEKGWLKLIVNRFISFAMVVGIGFILMVSLVVSALMEVLSGYIKYVLADYSIYLVRLLNVGVSLGIITLLFAMLFKFLPDARIRWQNVWRASIFTALLFTIGKYLISLYIGQSDMTTSFGAAASAIIILLWVNYSSLLFFIGAEFIYVYTRRKGHLIAPAKHAVRVMVQEIETETPLDPAEEKRQKLRDKKEEVRKNNLNI